MQQHNHTINTINIVALEGVGGGLSMHTVTTQSRLLDPDRVREVVALCSSTRSGLGAML